MKRIIFSFFLLFIFSVSSVKAESLLIIDNQGEVVWKVLSSTDSVSLSMPQREYLEVTGVAVGDALDNTKISLAKDGENINLLLVREIKI